MPLLAHAEDQPRVELWDVRDLLANQQLRIPVYQRPYAWSTRNVSELVDDIRQFTQDGTYRIGTIILHRRLDGDEVVLDVVDGQQRITTLHLLTRALRASLPSSAFPNVSTLQLSPFGTEQTVAHVKENAAFLARTLRGLTSEDVLALSEAVFTKCEVVVVTLTDLDEAFQMFDSQNTRGRALYPTDLLKAFHLREIGNGPHVEGIKREVVDQWENIPAAHVNALFSEYLFKIRRWAGGREVPKEGFTSAEIGMFKGIREGDVANGENHWARAFVYAKNFTDDYRSENSTLMRFGMLKPVDYPHQIDQPLLNGETFFRMVSHYYGLGVRLGLLAFRDDQLTTEMRAVREVRPRVTEKIDYLSQSGAGRSRYSYVRGLLDALLLYYRDRFGAQESERFATLAARYVMIPRAQNFAVRRKTINDHALGERPGAWGINLFREIRDATSSRSLLATDVPRPALYGSAQSRTNDYDVDVVDALWSAAQEEYE